jgi:hypothetical protein
MKKYIILLSLLFVTMHSFSQDGEDDDKLGVNKTNFIHNYINFGFMMPIGEEEGAAILYGKSHTFTYGIRYRYRVVDFFAFGLGLNYTNQVWHNKQISSKAIPDNTLYDKEKFFTNNLGSDVFIRFTTGNDDNTLGNYIDIGAYGEWVYSNSRELTINSDDPDNSLAYEYYNVTFKNLNYFQKINYGLITRIAYGKYVLFAKYRMSDMFTDDFKELITPVEFPRVIVGFEIGLHK